jgi:hypothetical protein
MSDGSAGSCPLPGPLLSLDVTSLVFFFFFAVKDEIYFWLMRIAASSLFTCRAYRHIERNNTRAKLCDVIKIKFN